MTPPVSRTAFAAANGALLDDRPLSDEELATWTRGRDWLAERTVAEDAHRNWGGTARRRHPRAKLAVSAHLAGVGRAFTQDVGFQGMALCPQHPTKLRPGDEAYVRLKLAERSVYVACRVAWVAGERVGVRIERIHPRDEQVLQAAVCDRLLERWA